MTRPAFTLVELLAVLILVEMAMALSAVGLASAGDEARLGEGAARVRDTDRVARLSARRTGSPVRLVLDDDGAALAVTAANDGRRLAEARMPAGVHVELTPPNAGQRLAAILVDAAGRSDDYRVQVVAGRRRTEWLVCGLTGWGSRREATLR